MLSRPFPLKYASISKAASTKGSITTPNFTTDWSPSVKIPEPPRGSSHSNYCILFSSEYLSQFSIDENH